jgi:predicted amidophosphoribosyltransferase
LRERGYDQARLLAVGAAKRFRLPVESLLNRVRMTGQQVGRDRVARERNVRGAFRASPRARDLRICLIDDVLTTGATAAAATEALLEAGAARVEVRTLARAP